MLFERKMSTLKQISSSSTSECDPRYAMLDEKKRKRMISNRESARRSRMRKQKQLQDLTEDMGKLQLANNEIVGKIDETTEKYMIFAAENNVLRAQAMELTERLRSLNDLIKASGLPLDDEMPDPLLKPWQIPYPMQAIPASSALFQF